MDLMLLSLMILESVLLMVMAVMLELMMKMYLCFSLKNRFNLSPYIEISVCNMVLV